MIKKLDAELIMELKVDCAERLEVGKNDFGYLRAIMISGGSFEGEKLRGEIIPGGADWNMGYGGDSVDTITSVKVFAKYLLKTDYGCYIAIENLGYKSKVKENSEIATMPSFHAPRGKYEWLNYGVYVASLNPAKEGIRGVRIKVYKML
ncbi:DUF3237 domain-containing protein [Clostridium estertheticum]|uniref:DUF3237 domain-containing protein n=1 Tax=Clostridium estertheticum TaxID=238834 RepID=UPI001C6E08B7|nr:DUF3237 domain-containing protein [Clostridium estertheticum]MBW9171564.1 DUF3237 domain-containing protein [Clostridium estertheticum]WLC77061.1 DUF3237 domain-containing protein [Clostridium estertheticum]